MLNNKIKKIIIKKIRKKLELTHQTRDPDNKIEII